MMSVRRLCTGLALALLLLLAFAPAAHAQSVTTGTLTGAVSGTTDAGGGVLPGATVTAVHVPTGTTYTAVTGSDGRFVIPNVRPGGPYKISAAVQGYKTTAVEGVQAAVGTATDVTVELPLAAVEETIDVVASGEELINPNRTGSQSQVSTKQIETLPTVRRNLQDFARTNPYFAVDPQDASQTRINVAGRNNRYNQIQIDGAVNNDLFGLADTGTPGGQTDSQPISLDAIAQLQLVLSPYDVRQGGFTGGGINAVTRSGSNDWEGSIYGSKRNASFVGDGPTGIGFSDFDESQYGLRLGGPAIKDKLFFFVNGERNRKDQPTGTSANGSAATNYGGVTSPAAVSALLQSRYGYDTGGLGDIAQGIDGDLAFARLDWNAAQAHQITLRHNYVKANKDIIENRTKTSFRYPNSIYSIADKTNSTVLQVNSVLGAYFNEGRLGYQTIRDVRTTPGTLFPTVEIGGTGPRGGDVISGTERFSGANSLDQDVFELTDDLTMLFGDHTVTVGTHNEAFKFDNLFLSDFYGYYYFPNTAAFTAGLATNYSIGFATGADPKRAIGFKAQQYGIYGSDQWRAHGNFTLTFGLRLDKPSFPDSPSFNPLVQTAIGFSTASTPSEDVVYSPRLGFNWSPSSKDQVRGGIGIFAGRTPYVWVSNAYANTGIESVSLSSTCPGGTVTGTPCIPFNPDPLNQPHAGGAGSSISVDLVDPDFKFPRVVRGTLGYDRELPWGIRGTAEVVFSQTQEDVFYLNVAKHRVGTSPLDGRPTFASNSPLVSNAYFLTNTSKGDEKVGTIQLSRNFSHGLTMTANYAYMDTESALDATSSRAVSNFQFRPTKGDIFDDDTAHSMFEVRHRFNFGPSYTFTTGPVAHSVALFYNAQAGRPYSLLFGSDINGDGFSTNDLLFVPGAADAIILKDSAGNIIPYSRFADFLRSAGVDTTAGRILNRNESREPWSHIWDFHYGVELPVHAIRTSVALDILNLLNLFDKDRGNVHYVNNQTYTPVRYSGIDTATGKPIYQAVSPTALNPGNQFLLADLRSRWQAKLSLRFSF